MTALLCGTDRMKFSRTLMPRRMWRQHRRAKRHVLYSCHHYSRHTQQSNEWLCQHTMPSTKHSITLQCLLAPSTDGTSCSWVVSLALMVQEKTLSSASLTQGECGSRQCSPTLGLGQTWSHSNMHDACSNAAPRRPMHVSSQHRL